MLIANAPRNRRRRRPSLTRLFYCIAGWAEGPKDFDLKALDLFSGIGGFSLGLERAGITTVAFCEIDPWARRVLRKHWPDVPIYEDVTKLKGADVGTVDLVCGGFPCQDISCAGKGAGLEGARSGLWWEMHRIIAELRPRWVLAENVGALRTRGADEVLASLEGLGYTCWPLVVGADDVGAPHRRKRVWLVAHRPQHGRGPGWEGRPDSSGEGERKQPLQADVPHTLGDPLRYGKQRVPRGRARGVPDQGSPEPVPHGAAWAVADANQQRPQGSGKPSIVQEVDIPRNEPAGSRADVGHPYGERREEQRGSEPNGAELAGAQRAGWWITEPDVGRVAHGVPRRVDRLRGLGNSVVPQIPELIGRAIMRFHAVPAMQ